MSATTEVEFVEAEAGGNERLKALTLRAIRLAGDAKAATGEEARMAATEAYKLFREVVSLSPGSVYAWTNLILLALDVEGPLQAEELLGLAEREPTVAPELNGVRDRIERKAFAEAPTQQVAPETVRLSLDRASMVGADYAAAATIWFDSMLGAGGESAVYRASRGPASGNRQPDCAAKLLATRWCTDPLRVARFEAQAQTLKQLPEGCGPAFHGMYRFDDGNGTQRYVIAMELLTGKSLREIIYQRQRGGEVSVDWPAVARSLLEGVKRLHDHNYLHLDIKPSNVMLADGVVRLIDFGAACSAGGEDSSHGTPSYMSKTRARSGDAGPEADVFACVATIVEAVTDELPYPITGSGYPDYEKMAATGDELGLAGFSPSFCDAVGAVLHGEDVSIDSLLAALAAQAEAPPPEPAQFRWKQVVLAFVLGVGVTGFGVWLASSSSGVTLPVSDRVYSTINSSVSSWARDTISELNRQLEESVQKEALCVVERQKCSRDIDIWARKHADCERSLQVATLKTNELKSAVKRQAKPAPAPKPAPTPTTTRGPLRERDPGPR